MSPSKTSLLAKLRKSTGYPLTNCKKALELHPDDFIKAEEWLHAEAKSKGWSKWAKIQTRAATQGLIGVYSKNNVGVMIEVNCETDFVSRNADFQQIVEKLLSGCIGHAVNLKHENEVTKAVLDESQLSAIPCESSTLGELLVASSMKFNEKTVAKRAVFLKVPEDVLLNSLTHPATLCPNLHGASLGKYGVLLASKEKEVHPRETIEDLSTEDIPTEDISTVRLNLCNHIVGMNPLSVGQLTEKDIAKFSERKIENSEDSECNENIENVPHQQDAESVQSDNKTAKIETTEEKILSENSEDSSDSQIEESETMGSELKESNETELVFQSFLMNPTVTVGETLYRSGIEILAFERFECGESSEESPDVALSASA